VAVGSGTGPQREDPRSFGTDDGAIQHLVDWAVENTRAATVHVPHIRPDGTPYVIENQVATPDHDSTPISFQFHGGGQSQSEIRNAMECEIDDGDAMFYVSGNVERQQSEDGDFQVFSRFDGLHATLGGNDAGAVHYAHARGGITNLHVSNYGGTAVRVAGRSFNGWLDDAALINHAENASDAVGIEFLEGKTGAGDTVTNGSDWIVGPNLTISGKGNDALVRSHSGFSRVALGGYFEGAVGTANIDWRSARLFVTPHTWSVHTKASDTHGIYLDGGHDHLVAPAYVGGNDGDGIHVTNGVGSFKIWPYTRVRNNAGTGIYVDAEGRWDGPATPVCLVPREECFQGSVEYTERTKHNVLYPDGRRRVATGTVTVPAGGSSSIDGVELPYGTKPHVAWSYASAPSGPTEVTYRYRSDPSSASGQQVVFVESVGDADATVEYRIEASGAAGSSA
jgi:hypothetical protein